MANVKFFKMNSLPTVDKEPNAFYYINDGGDIAEAWLTDASGNEKQIGNTLMVQSTTEVLDGGTF